MRLRTVEKGDGFFPALLIRFISMVSGMRLPDAARIVMYHPDFYGNPMSTWTHAAMRGESPWSVGERELFAAMTAEWNACPFCMGVHGAIASLVLDKGTLSPKMHAMLAFLEIFTKTPDAVTVEQVRTFTPREVEDAMAVATLFSITARCANAFDFAILNERDLSRGAKRMLVQGYVFGKRKPQGPPDHRALADELHKHVLEGPGITDSALRQAMASRAAGGPSLEEAAYDDLALQIGQASYKVTDGQVRKVVQKAGSEKAAFELMVAAAVGAGFYRWRQAT